MWYTSDSQVRMGFVVSTQPFLSLEWRKNGCDQEKIPNVSCVNTVTVKC